MYEVIITSTMPGLHGERDVLRRAYYDLFDAQTVALIEFRDYLREGQNWKADSTKTTYTIWDEESGYANLFRVVNTKTGENSPLRPVVLVTNCRNHITVMEDSRTPSVATVDFSATDAALSNEIDNIESRED